MFERNKSLSMINLQLCTAHTWNLILSPTVRMLEHDRKCQPSRSFHQKEGKHLAGGTSLPVDTQQLKWKVQTELPFGSVHQYHLITTIK